VLLVVLTTVRVFGQETFTPLIGENTIVFAHIDLRKIEIDTIKSQSEKLGVEFLKQLNFDEKSLKATRRELENELEKLDALVRPPYETITKIFGIQELAIIADLDLLENNIVGVLAVPWKGKTKNDTETLQSFLTTFLNTSSREIPENVVISDFLFFIFPAVPYSNQQQRQQLDEVTKLALIAWLQNITPSKDSPIQQGLQILEQDEIKIVAALPEKIKTRLVAAANILPDDIPKEIKGLLLFAAQKIEWAAASFSINALFSDETINNNVLLTLKTPKRTDALQLRSLMENAIEFGMNIARFGMEQEFKQEKNGINIPPLFFEFVKGLLRTLLPDVENDKLVFRLKSGGMFSKHAALANVSTAVSLTLPAIQAARETAMRMQCKNNIKQIILAFHNYYDTYSGLPPLYTVDKDGKPLHSWRVLILPFMEQTALYQKIRHNEPWDSEYNKQFHNINIDVYRCPTNPLAAQQNGSCCYSVIAGEGIIPAAKAGEQTCGTLARIIDGTSNVFAVVEVKEPFCWMDPTADINLEELLKGINNKEGRVGGFHPEGINVGLFDGSVWLLQNSTPKDILKAFGTRDGGEAINNSEFLR
jgi:hypothetical protein